MAMLDLRDKTIEPLWDKGGVPPLPARLYFRKPSRFLINAALVGALFFLSACATTQRANAPQNNSLAPIASTQEKDGFKPRIDCLQSLEEYSDFLANTASPYSEQQRKVILRDFAMREPLLFLAYAEKINPPDFREILVAKARDTDTIMKSLAKKTKFRSVTNVRTQMSAGAIDTLFANPAIVAEIKAHPDCFRIMDVLFEVPVYPTLSPYPEETDILADMPLTNVQKTHLFNKVAGQSETVLKHIVLSKGKLPDYIVSLDDLTPAITQLAETLPGAFLSRLEDLQKLGVSKDLLKTCKATALRTLHDVLNSTNNNDRFARRQSELYCLYLNIQHSASPQERFGDLTLFTPSALLGILRTNGKDAFTSTFIGLTKGMMASLAKRGQKLDDFIDSAQEYDLHDVFTYASAFGLEKLVMSGFSTPKMRAEFTKGMIDRFKRDIDHAERDYISPNWTPKLLAINAAIANVGSPEQKAKLERDLAALYQAIELPQAKMLCGMAISAYVDANPERIKSFPSADALTAYPLHNHKIVPENQLFKNGTCTMRLCFFGDDDGRASFNHFVSAIRADNDWKISDQGTFVTMERKAGKRTVLLVANKPLDQKMDSRPVEEYLAKIDAKPSIVVLRGHSFYGQQAIDVINPEAAIYFDGGCGGYDRTHAIINKSQDCSIIGTQQEATMFVNDPLVLLMARQALENGSLDFTRLESQAKATISDQRLSSYIFPHRNYASLMFRAAKTFIKPSVKNIRPTSLYQNLIKRASAHC